MIDPHFIAATMILFGIATGALGFYILGRRKGYALGYDHACLAHETHFKERILAAQQESHRRGVEQGKRLNRN